MENIVAFFGTLGDSYIPLTDKPLTHGAADEQINSTDRTSSLNHGTIKKKQSIRL